MLTMWKSSRSSETSLIKDDFQLDMDHWAMVTDNGLTSSKKMQNLLIFMVNLDETFSDSSHVALYYRLNEVIKRSCI